MKIYYKRFDWILFKDVVKWSNEFYISVVNQSPPVYCSSISDLNPKFLNPTQEKLTTGAALTYSYTLKLEITGCFDFLTMSAGYKYIEFFKTNTYT